MDYITVILVSICMTVCLISGSLLWAKRKDVPDRSRAYLAFFCLWVGIGCTLFLSYSYVKPQPNFSRILLAPELVFGGLFATIMYLCYPIEVMRPRQLCGVRLLLLFLPLLLVTLPMLFGMQCRVLHSWDDLVAHIGDFDVWLRIVCLVLLAAISLILFFIPYNWRKSSADFGWICRTTLMGVVMTLLFYCEAFTNMSIFFCLHMSWCIFVVGYLTYHEFSDRLLPPADKEDDLADVESTPALADNGKGVDTVPDTRDYWPRICQLMDNQKLYLNSDLKIQDVASELGVHPNVVSAAINSQGNSFNQFVNDYRIEFAKRLLLEEPDKKVSTIYYEVGFAHEQTFFRAFKARTGMTPSEWKKQESTDKM